MSGAGQSSTEMQKKRPKVIPTTNLPLARNLFDETSAQDDRAYYQDFMEHIIFEDGAGGEGYNGEETQSQDGCDRINGGQDVDDMVGHQEEADGQGEQWQQEVFSDLKKLFMI